MDSFQVGSVAIGGIDLVVIAGPCVAESLDLCDEVCSRVKDACDQYEFQYIFKSSFDKANRTSVSSSRGHGIEEGLEIIKTIAHRNGVPSTTDVHLPDQCSIAAQAVNLLQVPAFLCRQTDLLQAAAQTGLPVNVKKGQFLAPQDTLNIVDKLKQFGAKGIMLTERGTTFGYNSLVVDMPGLTVMRNFGVPVCFDATHSAQRPGALGASTGGARDTIPAMIRAATAVGIDALFLEVHPNPANAQSDAETQWPLNQIDQIFEPMARIRAALNNG